MEVQDEVVTSFARRLRQRMGRRVKSIILFGSRARGDAHPGSDYDFVVVLDERTEENVKSVRKLETELLDEFDALSGSLVYSEKDWELRKSYPIGITIARDGVKV